MFIKNQRNRRRPCKRHSLSTPNPIDYQMSEFLHDIYVKILGY